MTKNVRNECKYPENIKIRDKMNTGDKAKIARMTGYKVGSVREILNGYRFMNDEVKRAIIQLFAERDQINKSIEEIANQ